MTKPPRLAPAIKAEIRALLAALDPPPVAARMPTCKGCGTLLERSRAVLDAGQLLPAAALGLEEVLWYGDAGVSRLLRCNRCGGLFLHELSHDFDIAESRDEVSLSRCTAEEAVDYLDTHLPSFRFLALVKKGATWVVSYDLERSLD